MQVNVSNMSIWMQGVGRTHFHVAVQRPNILLDAQIQTLKALLKKDDFGKSWGRLGGFLSSDETWNDKNHQTHGAFLERQSFTSFH